MGGGSAAAKEVMDDMLVTGSPAPGRKEVWVERCLGEFVWVGPTAARGVVDTGTRLPETARKTECRWVEKGTLRRI